MAQNFTLNFPDSEQNRITNAFAKIYGYQAKLSDGQDNPETKKQFTKRMIAKFVSDVVKNFEVSEAAREATHAAEQVAGPEIT